MGCEYVVEAKTPETVVVDKVEKLYLIYNGVIPKDVHVHEKKKEKFRNINISGRKPDDYGDWKMCPKSLYCWEQLGSSENDEYIRKGK